MSTRKTGRTCHPADAAEASISSRTPGHITRPHGPKRKPAGHAERIARLAELAAAKLPLTEKRSDPNP